MVLLRGENERITRTVGLILNSQDELPVTIATEKQYSSSQGQHEDGVTRQPRNGGMIRD